MSDPPSPESLRDAASVLMDNERGVSQSMVDVANWLENLANQQEGDTIARAYVDRLNRNLRKRKARQ